jgi:8-oxo-dGTP pyrophosphatase MutT (NUDIX family)
MRFDSQEARPVVGETLLDLRAANAQHAAELLERWIFLEQATDLIEAQAEIPQREQSVQTGELGDTVRAVARCRVDLCGTQQPELVVVPQRAGRHVAEAGEISDAQHDNTIDTPSHRVKVKEKYRGRRMGDERRVMSGTEAMTRALDEYRARGETEAADVARLRALLGHGDVFDRSTPVHVTGSALIVHLPTRTVLLRWHPRMQMWMQVGGHFDAGETEPRVVALREAREETGLPDLRSPPTTTADHPVQIVIVPVPAHGDEPAHEHADFRYVFVTETPDAIVAESPEARLRWVDLAVAAAETPEENLRVFLSRVSEVFRIG